MESTCPDPLPLTNIVFKKALNSCEINKELLQPVHVVVKKYDNLIKSGHSQGNVRILAVKLAKEAILREEVMRRCTPGDTRDLPGLPHMELYDLKRVVLALYPQYWNCIHDFEGV